ncbi:hypothetical protein Y032_0003g1222 [Ancylostoma ceylanicum]|uniref:Uncharacterized protein n=1 Tax=Ancylostoma ceylanicum TaxID=53326 RepID=A0A016VWQ7_9BILA|nr:hypothetical protein Y032_0003g1222 [Ancylostoma ceylanicum]
MEFLFVEEKAISSSETRKVLCGPSIDYWLRTAELILLLVVRWPAMSFIDSNSEDQPGFEKHGRAARSRRGVRLTTSRYLAVAIGPANLQYKYCVGHL